MSILPIKNILYIYIHKKSKANDRKTKPQLNMTNKELSV